MTRRPYTPALLAAGLLVGAAGCSSDSSSASDTMSRRQDAALRDPFSYGPTVPGAGAPARAGQNGQPAQPGAGGVADPNAANPTQRDDSANADWNRFWNP